MKLAILAQAWLYDEAVSVNGTLVQLHNLAVAFSDRGVEVHYVTSTLDKSKKQATQENGITFHWVKTSLKPLSWVRLMPAYRRLIEEIEPDAVYIRGRNVFQFVAGRYAGKYKKNYVWGTNGDDGAELWKNIKRLLTSSRGYFKKVTLFPFIFIEDLFINKGMRMAQYIVNQSVYQQERTRLNLHKEGIILPSYFLLVENNVQKENKILWLATLSPNKQPELFIDLIKQTDTKNWSAILGGGTRNEVFEQKNPGVS